eukprot:1136694-Pelagomonas_calceolata.AAC.1
MCVKYRVTASVRWWGFMGRIPSTCACARCRGTGSTREVIRKGFNQSSTKSATGKCISGAYWPKHLWLSKLECKYPMGAIATP